MHLYKELSLLQMEYERMAADIRMYTQGYASKFSLFGILVIAVIAFVLKFPKYEPIYLIIPYFLFAIAGLAIAQAYIIACLSERIRQIEKRVTKLNSGNPILKWEHVMAKKFIYPQWLNIKRKNNKSTIFQGLNPAFWSVILLILFIVLPIIIFCFFKSWSFILDEISLKWVCYFLFWLYFIITYGIFICIVWIWWKTSFFRLGAEISNLDYSEENRWERCTIRIILTKINKCLHRLGKNKHCTKLFHQ